jgi:hypothetical protein
VFIKNAVPPAFVNLDFIAKYGHDGVAFNMAAGARVVSVGFDRCGNDYHR